MRENSPKLCVSITAPASTQLEAEVAGPSVTRPQRAVRAIRVARVLAVLLLSGSHCAHGNEQPASSAPRVYDEDEPRPLPGLSVRGTGCHVELLAPTGSVICTAIVTPLPGCLPFTGVRSEVDGGTTVTRLRLGSECPSPRVPSTSFGGGSFYVEGPSGAVHAICDDASKCQRGGFRRQILECCRQDTSLQETALCREVPTLQICSGSDAEEAETLGEVDGGR